MAYRLKVGLGRTFRPGVYRDIDDAKRAAKQLANETGSKVSIWDDRELPSMKAYRGASASGKADRVAVDTRPGQAPANRKRTVKRAPASKAEALRSLFRKNPDARGNPRFGEYYFIDNIGNYITDKSLKALMTKAQRVATLTGKRIKIMQEDLTREKKHHYTSKRSRT